MAGKLAAVLVTVMIVAAGIMVVGTFLWIQGASTITRPTAYAGMGSFRDDTTATTLIDASRAVSFTFRFVTDQPWSTDSFADWTATLAADAGSNVSSINIGTLGAFLCNSQCTNSRFVYDDLESVNQTAPFFWATYPGTPGFLTGLNGAGPVYVTFNLAMTVFYRDGTYWNGGWWSGVYFGPMLTDPGTAELGPPLVAWGFILFVPSAVVVFVAERERLRMGL